MDATFEIRNIQREIVKQLLNDPHHRKFKSSRRYNEVLAAQSKDYIMFRNWLNNWIGDDNPIDKIKSIKINRLFDYRYINKLMLRAMSFNLCSSYYEMNRVLNEIDSKEFIWAWLYTVWSQPISFPFSIESFDDKMIDRYVNPVCITKPNQLKSTKFMKKLAEIDKSIETKRSLVLKLLADVDIANTEINLLRDSRDKLFYVINAIHNPEGFIDEL